MCNFLAFLLLTLFQCKLDVQFYSTVLSVKLYPYLICYFNADLKGNLRLSQKLG